MTEPPVGPFVVGRLPRIVFGGGRLAELPALVAALGSRALVLAGSSFAGSDRWPKVQRGLEAEGIDVVLERLQSGEPSPERVDAVVAARRKDGFDVVVGIGGGSVLDTAKAVAGLLRTGTSVLDHLEGVGPQLPYPGPAVPFVAVPTTAGTGSEATKNAVLSRRGTDGFKRSFRDDRLVAAVALVDPELLATCPPALIAVDGMDAVTQLLEAYVSRSASPFTDALALSGLAAARDALVRWHEAAARPEEAAGASDAADASGPAEAPDTSDTADARERMAYAALLSGVCLAQAGLGAVHGLAAPLGARFPIPHGAACAATLAAATRVNVQALERRDPENAALAKYAALGRLLDSDADTSSDSGSRERLVALLDDWRRRLGIPGLAAFGVAERDIPALVADSRGSSMRTNPLVLTDEEIASIVRGSL